MPDNIVVAYVARHGTTQLNQAGKFRGGIDVPLDEKGRQDAKALAAWFQQIELCGIVSSDKVRSAETAEIIGRPKGIRPVLTPTLQTLNLGEFSGKDKNKENLDKLHWYVVNRSVPIPGGESLNQFSARVDPALLEAVQLADNAGYPILLVGHSSIIHEVGTVFNGDNISVLVEPGGIVAIYAPNGKLPLKAKAVFKAKKFIPEKDKESIS